MAHSPHFLKREQNNKTESGFLERRLRYLQRAVPVVVLTLIAFHVLVTHPLLDRLDPAGQGILEIVLYGVSGMVVAWFGLHGLAQSVGKREAALRQAESEKAFIQQQLQAVHEVGRRLATATDVQEVMEVAVRAPVQLAEALGSAMVGFNDEHDRLNLEMAWGLSDTYVQALRSHIEKGIPAGRCRNCVPLRGLVTEDCPLFQGLAERSQKEGISSLVCLPIVREQQRVGIIGAYLPHPEGPTEEQMHLLNIVATEIAATIEGVRQRARSLATLNALGATKDRDPDLDTMLQQVLQTMLQGWGVGTGAIFLFDNEEDSWLLRVRQGLPMDPSNASFRLAQQMVDKALATDQTLIMPSSTDPLPVLTGGLASAAVIPLVVEGERAGAIFLASKRSRAFLSPHIPLLSALAHQTALAIHNIQLRHQVEHVAVLEERYRLSREMHDGLAQTLSSLGWQVDHLAMLLEDGRLAPLASELTELQHTVREAYLDVREAIDGLRLPVDHPGGLITALQEYVTDFTSRTGVMATLMADGEMSALPPIMALQLLRIVQEALTNVRKHAAAHHAGVQLHKNGGTLLLSITDDGEGFNPDMPLDHHHLGMASMRERTESLHGQFTLATGPKQGTHITITVPLVEEEGSGT